MYECDKDDKDDKENQNTLHNKLINSNNLSSSVVSTKTNILNNSILNCFCCWNYFSQKK